MSLRMLILLMALAAGGSASARTLRETSWVYCRRSCRFVMTERF